MSKIRIYQLAKDLNLSSSELIDLLKELGVEVKSHMSGVDEITHHLVKELWEEKKKKEEAEIKEVEKVETEKICPVEELQPPPPKDLFLPEEKKETKIEEKVAESQIGVPVKGVIKIDKVIRIRDLAEKLKTNVAQVIKTLLKMGIAANINQSVTAEVAEKLCAKFNFKVEIEETEEEKEIRWEEETEEKLISRPPVVTIMGHVDHGKTKLLDAIRKSNITEREAGGITQHIGAYQVEYNGKKIVFLDTPGHEAFTAMRARGAKVTDIVVLVVAADDGVMPQTIEAIDHARAAGVPIIVAINKIDKPDANVERVKRQLADINLMPEEWGGDTVFIPISAKYGQGLDELLEILVLQAELLELKANPTGRARGTIIEAKLDRFRGNVATVLVQNGTLMVGDAVVAGNTWGKIKAMITDTGERVKFASPGMPIEIIGISSLPQAGDILYCVENEKVARQIAQEIQEEKRAKRLKQTRVTLDGIHQQIKEGRLNVLNLIIKADVQGSLEALWHSLERLENEEVRIKIIHAGVGSINESDVMLASASNAIIIGFNVRPTPSAKNQAANEGVDIRIYNVIYYVIEDIKAAMEGMLEPKYEEVIIGRGEVRAVFRTPKLGQAAGCYVQEGVFKRGSKVRIIRDNIQITEVKITSLRRFKDDVAEIKRGLECGLGSEEFNDWKEGDQLEVVELQEVGRG